jgi:hypothetical protein
MTMLRIVIASLAMLLIAYSICCNSKTTTLGTNENTTTGSNTVVFDLPMPPFSSSLSTITSRVSHRWLLENETSEQALIQKIAAKLKPVELQVATTTTTKPSSKSSSLPILKPHQFLHLHHMKTGGTSIDHMLRCAMDRLQGNRGFRSKTSSTQKNDDTSNNTGGPLYQIPYYNIHECSRSQFSKCLKNPNDSCRSSMKDAAVMSYCAGLQHLNEFGWKEWGSEEEDGNLRRVDQEEDDEDSEEYDDDDAVDSDDENVMENHEFVSNEDGEHATEKEIVVETKDSNITSSSHEILASERIRAFTVLRHPVDRVWSMYKFQTKNCYKCLPLVDIYHRIDTNTTSYKHDDGTLHELDDLCLNQLSNHEVTNMLTSSHWPVSYLDNEETQAAMVTEAINNMKKYFTVIGLTEELDETRRILGKVFPWMNETLDGYEQTCPLPHDNSSPFNNRCVQNEKGHDSHLNLPKHPDEETRQAILAHNTLDMMLYDAAVDYFELQKRAMDWGEEES